MNISEALRKIKKIKGDLAKHQPRLSTSISYIETEPPAFRYAETFSQVKELSKELVELESKIAEKNATTKVNLNDKEVSLSFIIRSLQEIKSRITLVESFIIRTDTITIKDRFYSDEEDKYVTEKVTKKYVSDITEMEKDKMISDLKEEFEKLNSLLENANHVTSI
jgi:hypothetical protein